MSDHRYSPRTIRASVLVGGLALAGGVLFLDSRLPPGLAGGIPYVVVPLIGLWSPRRIDLLLLAGLCSVLTLAGYSQATSDIDLWKELANRSMALAALWSVAVLGYRLRQTLEAQQTFEHVTASLIDNALDAVITIDESGIVRSFNRTAERIFGYAPRQVIGKDVALLMSSPDREKHAEYLSRYRRTGQGSVIGVGREVTARRRDGSVFPAQLTLSEHSAQGERLFCGTLQDLTDRKLAESEAHYLAAIVDSSRDAIVGRNLEGRIMSWNPAAEELFGYTHDEILGRDLSLLVPADRRKEAQALITRTDAGERIQQVETVRLHKDGSRIEVALTMSPIRDQGGEILGISGIVRDIRKSKEASLELQRARSQAERADRMKGEFLANMSHEIRTPLTAILGFADEMLDGGDLTQIPPERLESLNSIRRNGEHLLQIVNDLLDLSKIESGKLELELLPCSPVQIVAEVCSLMQVRAAEKGIQIRTEYPTAVPAQFTGDPTRIRQVLFNLIGNAIKFSEGDADEIKVVTRLAGDDSQARLEFEIIDQGIGMTPEQMVHLFDPFVQADASTTRLYGGTGLGLSICERMVKAMGGSIGVESTPHRGSHFCVSLPIGPVEQLDLVRDPVELLEEPDDTLAGERNREAAALQDVSILLAEDSLDNQVLLRRVLERAGARVEVVDDGHQALGRAIEARANGETFDVILMDMQMPTLDGYGATRALRKANYEGPVIAITAHAMASDRDKCLEAGCDDYLTKPIDRKSLFKTIGRYVGDQKSQPNAAG